MKNDPIEIRIVNETLEKVDTMKYLGVNIDQLLSFDKHIDTVVQKSNQRTRLLWKMRGYISEDLAKYLYITLIHPLFTYCDFVYDGTYEYNKHKLQVSQNNALRAVKKCNREFPNKYLHDILQIDDLDTCRCKSTLKMVYRGLQNLGPTSLNDMFTYYEPARSLRSENQMLIQPPKSRTKFGENDINIRGSRYWNAVPRTVKLSDNIDSFKNTLKQYGQANITNNN